MTALFCWHRILGCCWAGLPGELPGYVFCTLCEPVLAGGAGWAVMGCNWAGIVEYRMLGQEKLAQACPLDFNNGLRTSHVCARWRVGHELCIERRPFQ